MVRRVAGSRPTAPEYRIAHHIHPFIGDAALALSWRPGAALLKGGVMDAFGLWVAGGTV